MGKSSRRKANQGLTVTRWEYQLDDIHVDVTDEAEERCFIVRIEDHPPIYLHATQVAELSRRCNDGLLAWVNGQIMGVLAVIDPEAMMGLLGVDDDEDY